MENKIQIKAFGMIAEKLGSSDLELKGSFDSDNLRSELEKQFPDLKGMKYSFAVNRALISENVQIPNEAEVALLPPFSGG